MRQSRLAFGWIILAGLVTLCALPLLTLDSSISILRPTTQVLLLFTWLFPIMLFVMPERMQSMGQALTEVRVAVNISLLLSLLFLIIMILLWGLFIIPEFSLFSFAFVIYVIAIQWGWGNVAQYRQRVARAFENNFRANMMIAVLTFVLMFAVIELTVRFTTIQPDGFAMTLQFTTWYERYFEPINSLGYRGYEPIEPTEQQQSILVVGDSFAVGHGINDLDDIFAYQLANILGDNYVVNLHAHIGISPNVSEWVETYPVKPDILILSHFVNDIEHTEIPGIATYRQFVPSGITEWFTKRYFLASFVYWHIYVGPRMVASYADELLSAFEDPQKWDLHQARLEEFVDWAAENDAKLIVLVWPVLNDLDVSDAANARVGDLFGEQNIPVVQMRDALEGLTVQERMLNSFDAHPSILANRLAAEALAEVIQGQD